MMTEKIRIPERTKAGEDLRLPRYFVLAVSGSDLRIDADHFRCIEIEGIAKGRDAEIGVFEPMPGSEHGTKK